VPRRANARKQVVELVAQPQQGLHGQVVSQRRRRCSTISGNQSRCASPAATAHHLRLVPIPSGWRPSPERRQDLFTAQSITGLVPRSPTVLRRWSRRTYDSRVPAVTHQGEGVFGHWSLTESRATSSRGRVRGTRRATPRIDGSAIRLPALSAKVRSLFSKTSAGLLHMVKENAVAN
jgi:hypothetical protein